ncbi:butyrophilin-like protein 2 [Engraulis encrasicolus]|uniref:butyrophilin-like protein 2 n=1 Tax=Engraulis encrasicolus TaxID=184585 RepID=UPI002FD43CDB
MEYLVVTGSGVEVFASLGKDVVLSCDVDSHVEITEVTWRKPDEDITVLQYRHGDLLPDSSHHRYRGRAAFFTSEISKGNFSLRLKDIRTEDKGEYVCDVHISSHTGKATVRISILGFQLQGPSGPLAAQLGGSVLLPCAAESPLPLEELEVEWRRADSGALLHLFQEGEERPESQDQAYRGRVDFFPVDMDKGNFSILLKNVSEGDIGVYSCKVYTEHEAKEVRVDLVRVEYPVVTGSDVEVFASLGGEVVLSCHVDSHVEITEVTWRKADQEVTVLKYRHGDVLPDSSHHRYRGRAAFFTTGISKGNFSLRLKDIRTEDKGEYICEAHTSSHTGKATVRILVLGLSPLHCLVLACSVGSFVVTSVALVHFMTKGYRAMQDLASKTLFKLFLGKMDH